MQYIVLYDISCSKRLNKVAKILLDYGVRIQYSIFLIDVQQNIFEKMLTRLKKVLNSQEDKIVYHSMCVRCMKNIQVFGINSFEQEERKSFYVL